MAKFIFGGCIGVGSRGSVPTRQQNSAQNVFHIFLRFRKWMNSFFVSYSVRKVILTRNPVINLLRVKLTLSPPCGEIAWHLARLVLDLICDTRGILRDRTSKVRF